MTKPDPFNDKLDMDDSDLLAEFRMHAFLVATCDDGAEIAVRMCRMRDLLQEYLGKPIGHGDFRDQLRRAEIEEEE